MTSSDTDPFKNLSLIHSAINLQPEGARESAYIRQDAPFRNILRDCVRTVPGNTRVKFQVCSFNRFKLV